MKNRLLLLAVVLAFAGCSKCGKGTVKGAAPLEQMLPRGAVSVVVIPDLGRLGSKLQQVQQLKVAGFAAQLNGFTSAQQWGDALVQAVGIDVRNPQALKDAGLSPERGAGVAVMLDGTVFVLLPLADEAKFKALVTKLAAQRFGAVHASTSELNGVPVTVFDAAPGQPAKLGYALSQGWALLGAHESVAKLSGFGKLTDSDQLAKEPAYGAALKRLPGGSDLVVYLPPGSPALRWGAGSLAVAVSLEPTKSLTVTADAPWRGDPQMLEVLKRVEPKPLLKVLPADAFLVAQFAGDPKKAAPFVSLVGPHLERAFRDANFDVKTQVLDHLAPGVFAGLSLSPDVRLQQMPELNIRTTNPFAYAHLTGVAEATEPKTIAPAIDQVAAAAPKFGAKIEKRERDGQTVYFTTYSAGEGVHLLPKDDRVYFGSPLAKVDEWMKLAPSEGPVTDPQLKAVLDARAVAVVVDLARLSSQVRELPNEAWGLGGFAMKASSLRWLDATDDLKALTVGLEAKEGALQAQLVLKIVPAPAKVAPAQ